MLANYSLLRSYCEEFSDLRIVDDSAEVRAVQRGARRVLRSTPGQTISLVTAENPTVITLSGVKWALNAEAVDIGTRAISNVAKEEFVNIEVHEGSLFVCQLDL